jgi:hypothetical protein
MWVLNLATTMGAGAPGYIFACDFRSSLRRGGLAETRVRQYPEVSDVLSKAASPLSPADQTERQQVTHRKSGPNIFYVYSHRLNEASTRSATFSLAGCSEPPQ